MSDQSLKEAVLVGLYLEPRINATYIEVSANDGVVRLAGHVESYLEKWVAKRVAALVSGVRAVSEELSVGLPGDDRQYDQEIVERALHVLFWDVAIPPDRIKVKFNKGWITLTGVLDRPYQKSAAEMDVRNVRGVIGVINEITLGPAAQPPAWGATTDTILGHGASAG